MPSYFSVGTVSAGVSSLTIDAGYLVDRAANLLRRADLKTEILHWLNFAQWQLAHRVRFPELLTTSSAITVVADTYTYALPADYAQMERVFYKATYASPAWGRGLTPLPKRFYGEPIDLERGLNVPVASRRVGDPQYFLVQNKTLVIDSSPNSSTIPAELYATYYKIPSDLISSLDTPAIDKQWRQYLIWIAFYWGKAALEQEDATKAMLWERKAEQVIASLARKLNTVENSRETYELPNNGLEVGDEIY